MNTNPQPEKRIFVGRIRKDGKLPCLYVFPISDRKISKLLTPEKLEHEKANGYLILNSTR